MGEAGEGGRGRVGGRGGGIGGERERDVLPERHVCQARWSDFENFGMCRRSLFGEPITDGAPGTGERGGMLVGTVDGILYCTITFE